jgi:hypothetical protein
LTSRKKTFIFAGKGMNLLFYPFISPALVPLEIRILEELG